MKTFQKAPEGTMPPGVTLEKAGRNLDSLAQTDALQQLKRTVIHEWKVRNRFSEVERFGIRPTTLVLFHGPPGNGKTMASKMLAKEIGCPLYRVSCDGLLSSYLGSSEANMAAAMKYLETVGRSVVLFDECETLFRSRDEAEGACGKAIASTMQVFWQAVDRWESDQLFILATNMLESVDSAVLSRCENVIEFTRPTKPQFELILTYWQETLHEYGADVWGPVLRERFSYTLPVSFRAIWQAISHEVRQFIISQ